MKPAIRSRRGTAFALALFGVVATGGAIGPSVAMGQTAGPPGCRTSQLTVWRGDPGNGAAGSIYYELQFSNISTRSCSLFGFPGVSAVTAAGYRLGTPAVRDHAFSPTTVVLAPGTTAHAVLRVVNALNFPSTTCQPTTAAALKIYPPNQTAATVLAFRFPACAKAGPVYMYVRTVRPRAGIPGYSQ